MESNKRFEEGVSPAETEFGILHAIDRTLES